MKYQNTEIAVIGAGSSGLAAARLARGLGASVFLVDSGDGDGLRMKASELAAEGISMFVGNESFVREPQRFSLCVVSPGVDLAADIARHFSNAGVPLIAEIEFGFQNTETPVVAITGTNGKTTTTGLTAELFNAAGLKTVPCGNYGTAFCDVVRENVAYDVHTIEVSSFQLELIETFRPLTAAWLNFAPDHLDRYASLDSYRTAKLRIFENQTCDDWVVANSADVPVGLKAQTMTFSAFRDDADFSLIDDDVCFRGERVVDFSKTNLRGRHNAENLMAAVAVARSRGIEFPAMTETIYHFRPPRHRCELVAVIDGVEYINDSKSTNLHSLETSLLSLRRPLILIAGGKDKGLDFGELRETVCETCCHVVAMGEIAPSLVECWGNGVSCEIAVDMEDAVRKAHSRASSGKIVLLSPGTSSFDMFGGYQERGEAYCQNVNRLM